jgi:hypothetical protein
VYEQNKLAQKVVHQLQVLPHAGRVAARLAAADGSGGRKAECQRPRGRVRVYVRQQPVATLRQLRFVGRIIEKVGNRPPVEQVLAELVRARKVLDARQSEERSAASAQHLFVTHLAGSPHYGDERKGKRN